MKTNSRLGRVNLFPSWLHAFKLHRKAACAGVLAVSCCLFMSLSSAQAGSACGDVHGVTLNALGAPVPGVQVSVHSVEDNLDRNVVSDHAGTFVVENLRPGRYQLRATKGGLASSSATTIDLAPRQDLRVAITLVAVDGSRGAAISNLTADSHAPAAAGNLPDAPLTDREKLLLERLDRLEQRLAAMEAKEAKGAAPAATPAAAPAVASAQPAPVVSPAMTSAATVAATQPEPAASASAVAAPAQPAPVASPAKTSATTVAAAQPAPVKHVLLASLEGAFGIKSAEKAPAISMPPSKQAAAAPATPAPQHVLPEALEAPEATTGVDNFTPFAYGDFTWLNGTPRNKDTVLDTKFFTPEIRFDTHYMEDFNQPIDHTMGGATESFRSGEVQVEQISVGGDFHWQNVRGRILTMDGLFATTTPRNDASAGVGEWDVRGAYKYVSEAYGGYHFNVNHGLNVDAGIFVSYIGLFSYYNFDNWTYQPSFVSSNTPWFFNGLRIQWFPTNKLKIEPWIINGWQSYNRYNGHLGLGGQLLYMPREWFKLVMNQYGYGQDNLGVPYVQRIHTDDSIEVRYYNHPNNPKGIDKAAFSLTGDLGCQYGPGFRCTGGATKDSFAGWMGYNRIWWGHDKYGLTYGGGKMSNPGRYLTLLPPINGADAVSGSPYFTENPGQVAKMWDTTITFQWMPREYITWWWEAGYRNSNVPYWTGRHGITPPGGNNGYPAAYVCNSGAAAYTAINNTNLDLADATTFCAANGNGGVWFPDLRKTQSVVSAGIMVKF
jgi:hypothetical protein